MFICVFCMSRGLGGVDRRLFRVLFRLRTLLVCLSGQFWYEYTYRVLAWSFLVFFLNNTVFLICRYILILSVFFFLKFLFTCFLYTFDACDDLLCVNLVVRIFM